MSRFTHPLIAFAEPARNGAGLLRTLLGLALAGVFVFLFVQVARLGMARVLLGAEGGGALGAARDTGSPLGVLLTLGVFLAVWAALWLVAPLVHRRPARTLFGPSGRIDWRHFRWGLAISVLVGLIAWAPLVLSSGGAITVFPEPRTWAVLLALALPLVFVQAAAEELLFRGYLMQQLAARSLNVLGWSVLPALLFGFAHPSEAGWLGLSYYHFVFGLIMAAVTSRTANLGAAIGLHFGNNVVNLLLIAPADMVSGLALLSLAPEVDIAPARIAYLVMMFVGAALFMGYMDFRFIRAWRAAKRAEREAEAAAAAEARRRREESWRPGGGAADEVAAE